MTTSEACEWEMNGCVVGACGVQAEHRRVEFIERVTELGLGGPGRGRVVPQCISCVGREFGLTRPSWMLPDG